MNLPDEIRAHLRQMAPHQKSRLTAQLLEKAAAELESSSKEIRDTWSAASSGIGQQQAYNMIQRMVDRLGYGRKDNNPPKHNQPE